MAIRVLIADDHPLMAEGIANTFEAVSDIDVKFIVSNGQEALNILAEELIDVVLLDIDMPVLNGIECAKQIVKLYPEIKIAILSMHQEASVIKHLTEIGVKSYMLKTIPSEELIEAVKLIYNGKHYFNDSISDALVNPEQNDKVVKIVNKSPLLDELTLREKEILRCITKGLTNIQIGEQLFISPRTVNTHKTNIMNKLEIRNVAGLVSFAFKNGLV